MKVWLCPCLLACLAVFGWQYREPLRAAVLQSSNPRPNDVALIQAGFNFRNGQTHGTQTLVRTRLLEREQIRKLRQQDKSFATDISAVLTNEHEAWQSQWESETDRLTRLKSQGLDDAAFKNSIGEALLDEAWLETQIQPLSEVSESELKVAFAQIQSQSFVPESWLMSHLFLSKNSPGKADRRVEIQDIQQKLNPESWRQLVQRVSEDLRSKDQAGVLGWLSPNRISPDILAAAQTMHEGEIRGPFSTQLGWHWFWCTAFHPKRALTFSEINSELEAAVTYRKRKIALEQILHRHPGRALQDNRRHQ